MTKYIAKMPDENGVIHFTEDEYNTWKILITRQTAIVQQYACSEFIKGLNELDLSIDQIPCLKQINENLSKTDWTMVPVKGTIGITEFFSMLKNREFPVATFIRIPEELDYLKQPDIFHELFGHGPLLMNPVYADFVQWYGEMGCVTPKELRPMLSRLFWYTIEFGLIQEADGLKAYGGGILSSYQETIFSIDSAEPTRLHYDMDKILLTGYDYTNIQPHYFIIDSWDVLYDICNNNQLLEKLLKLNGDQQSAFITC